MGRAKQGLVACSVLESFSPGTPAHVETTYVDTDPSLNGVSNRITWLDASATAMTHRGEPLRHVES